MKIALTAPQHDELVYLREVYAGDEFADTMTITRTSAELADELVPDLLDILDSQRDIYLDNLNSAACGGGSSPRDRGRLSTVTAIVRKLTVAA